MIYYIFNTSAPSHQNKQYFIILHFIKYIWCRFSFVPVRGCISLDGTRQFQAVNHKKKTLKPFINIFKTHKTWWSTPKYVQFLKYIFVFPSSLDYLTRLNSGCCIFLSSVFFALQKHRKTTSSIDWDNLVIYEQRS